jgi:hypothetical protein
MERFDPADLNSDPFSCLAMITGTGLLVDSGWAAG